MPRFRPCRSCGEPCQLGGQSPRPDPMCRDCMREQPGYGRSSALCSGCGKRMKRKATSADTPMCLDCIRSSPAYKGTRHPAEHRSITCAICGATALATTNRDSGDRRQKTCLSDECRKAAERQRSKRYRDSGFRAGRNSYQVWYRNCVECESLFVARRANQVTCGDECRRRQVIKKVLDRHYGFVQNAMREGPLLDYLIRRDRSRCGICYNPVRAKNGPMRPSIDHIQPRSLGGSDELVNLQLAHWLCNLRKNNRGGGEQLLLVG